MVSAREFQKGFRSGRVEEAAEGAVAGHAVPVVPQHVNATHVAVDAVGSGKGAQDGEVAMVCY